MLFSRHTNPNQGVGGSGGTANRGSHKHGETGLDYGRKASDSASRTVRGDLQKALPPSRLLRETGLKAQTEPVRARLYRLKTRPPPPYTGPCVAEVKGRECGSQAMALENHSLLPPQPISVYGQDRDTPRRACKSWRACVPRVYCFLTPEAQEGKLLPPGIPNPPRRRGSPSLSRPSRAVPACLGNQEKL